MRKEVNKKIQAYAMILTLVIVSLFPLINLHLGNTVTALPQENRQQLNSDWPYRKLITIDHTKVNATLINFPVLISHPSDSDLAEAAQLTGQDIKFVLYSDNTTKLNHEIEYYNHSNGNLITWVNIPCLSSTVDTKIWMYYGNNASGNQQNPQGTWNSDYLMVHHMNETGNIIDSTSHGLNAVNVGTTTESNGKIDGCRFFDSVSDRYDFGNNTALNPGLSSWTITLWTKIIHINNYDVMIKWGSNAGFFMSLINGSNGYNYIKVSDGVKSAARYWDTTWSNGNWHYITAVINRNTNKLDVYLDGDLHNGGGTGNITGFGSIASTTTFKLYGGTEGRHDEFTISTTVRNTSWIKTSYNNQNNPESFFSVGLEQQSSYTLIVTVDGQGNVTKNPNQPTYFYGSNVTLTAYPNSGWIFDHWSGDLTGSLNPATLCINGNKTVVASFIPFNTAPVAVNDSATVSENSSNTSIDVLANDYDPDGDNLTITAVTQPLNGVSSQDGAYVYYIPSASYTGSDFFTYNISDEQGGNASATVFITVIPLNTPPNTPSNPNPSNGTTNVIITTDLTWIGGDLDPDDIVRYDVYFDTTSTPGLISSNQSLAIYDLGELTYNTTYYWRIVSWDSHNASAEGDLWQFTTQPEGGEGIIVNITRPLENYFYLRSLRLFPLPRTTVVYGPITIKAKVTADLEVDRVEFYIDGKLKKTDTRAPYTYRWAPLRCFKHKISVTAYDVESHSASDEVTVFKWRLHPLVLMGGTALLLSSST
jgi:hypothetical protein